MENRVRCDACNRMRRECAAGCELAPFFPPPSPYEAALIDEVYGLRKVEATLKKIDCPEKKQEVMKNMLLEAELRVADPVVGAFALVVGLKRRLSVLERGVELNEQLLDHICAGLDQGRRFVQPWGHPIPVAFQPPPPPMAFQPPPPMAFQPLPLLPWAGPWEEYQEQKPDVKPMREVGKACVEKRRKAMSCEVCALSSSLSYITNYPTNITTQTCYFLNALNLSL